RGPLDEFDHPGDQLIALEDLGGILDALAQRALVRKDHSVGGPQLVDALAVEAAALEADKVEPCQMARITDGHAERDDVVLDLGHAADEGVVTDLHPPGDAAVAGEDDVIANLAVAGEPGVVRQNDMVTEQAIMGNVDANHQQTVIAD